MSDPGGTTRELENDRLPLSMPPTLPPHLKLEDSSAPREIVHIPTKEACAGVININHEHYYSRRPSQFSSRVVDIGAVTSVHIRSIPVVVSVFLNHLS